MDDITRINHFRPLGGDRNAHFLLSALSFQPYAFFSSFICQVSHSETMLGQSAY